MVHFCHVACSVDCFRVRLGLGRESGLGAFKCVMLCRYFEEKYLSWHNPLIQSGRRNNRLGKRNNEISLYADDGLNMLVGVTVQGGSCPGRGGIVMGAIVLRGNFLGGYFRGGNHPGGGLSRGELSGGGGQLSRG